MKQLDELNEMQEVEKNILEFIKHIRYNHMEDDSYLGLQIGTAQIIDLYESIYISMIVSNWKDDVNRNDLISDIADTTLAGRIIPQLDGYDYNKLSAFYDAVVDDKDFSFLRKSKEALYKMIH